MTNLFLKVNKDLFKLELNPAEILILAQVIEFNTNTGSCFMTDKAFAEMFGVSDSTISRAIKSLENKGFITRTTKNVKGGKERTITVNIQNIENKITSVNLKVDGDLQASNCGLTNVNLPVDKQQNDLIKDKLKDNIKYNNIGLVPHPIGETPNPQAPIEETKIFKF
jgi:DNA-binding MarR family transcriptional regulator